MGYVATYLNFQGRSEEAFNFYATVFGTQVRGLMRFRDAEGLPPMSEEDGNKVLHAEIDILGGHTLMATDMLESMGQQVRIGNNTTISLNLDTNEEADRFWTALSEGGSETAPMTQMFFGYWGVTLDKFGIRWMFNVAPTA